MTKLFKLLKNSLILALLLILSGCAGMQISDYPLTIKLPASGDCFTYSALSKKQVRIGSVACEAKLAKSIHIDSSTWALMKKDIQTNCQNTKCTQLTGAFDSVFIAIDQALQQIP